jgi:Amt family ammonium transporter
MSEDKMPEAEMMANGVLGGLVGVTAGCAYIETSGAVVIGLVAGILVYGGTYILENILKLDDVVGAIPVHGVCGTWGTLAVALFITEPNLPEGMNRMGLLGIQFLGALTCFIWTFGSACLVLHIINIIVPLRVPPDDEKLGLNVSEHGAVSSVLDLAYSMQDVTDKGSYSVQNKVVVEHGTEIGDLAHCFNQMIETVQHQRDLAAAEMNDYRGHMDNSVQLIADVIGNMVQSLGETGNKAVAMSESFQRATQTIEGLAGSLRDISSNTQQASQIAEAAAEGAEKSRGIVDVLGRSTAEIDQIISTITEIADQTQILSLNATIEAVHAGEAGRGFSVVANEVKTLAKQSSRAAEEISGRIKQIKEKMNETVSVIQHISEVIGQMNQINYDIAETVTEQARGAAQINELVHDTGLTVQEVLEYIQRVSQGADEISKQVNDSHNQFQQLMDKSEFAA